MKRNQEKINWQEVKFQIILGLSFIVVWLFAIGMAVSVVIAMFEPEEMKAHPLWMWSYSIVMVAITVGAPFVFRKSRKSATDKGAYWFIVINATLVTIVSALRLFIL